MPLVGPALTTRTWERAPSACQPGSAPAAIVAPVPLNLACFAGLGPERVQRAVPAWRNTVGWRKAALFVSEGAVVPDPPAPRCRASHCHSRLMLPLTPPVHLSPVTCQMGIHTSLFLRIESGSATQGPSIRCAAGATRAGSSAASCRCPSSAAATPASRSACPTSWGSSPTWCVGGRVAWHYLV